MNDVAIRFRFDLGELVTLKGMVEIAESPKDMQVLKVAARTYHEEVGGENARFYSVRVLHRVPRWGAVVAFSGQPNSFGHYRVLEDELAALPDGWRVVETACPVVTVTEDQPADGSREH